MRILTGAGALARWRATIVVYGTLGLVVFLAALDQTVVVAALPAILVDLEVPFTRLNQASWIVSGYLLGYTIALPVVGQFADVAGRRRALLGCLALFLLGSIGCALATELTQLVAARVFQAMGGGALLPVANAIVADRSDARHRALTLGAIGALAEAGGVLGPLYGAAIVDWVGWRTIFWLNLPLGAPALAAAFVGASARERTGGRLDLVGAALAAGFLGGLVVALSDDPAEPRPALVTIALLSVAIACLIIFILVERRTPHALVHPALFRDRRLIAAVIASTLGGVALIVAMVDVPLFAATALGQTAAEGALLLLRLTICLPIGALLGGVLTRRLGRAPAAALGFAIAASGLLGASRWTTNVDDTTLTASLAAVGLGLGLIVVPLTDAALDALGPERTATGAGLVVIFRLVGMTVGIAALTSFGLGRFQELAAAYPLPLPVPGETAAEINARVVAYQQSIQLVTVQVFGEIFGLTAVLTLAGIAVSALLATRRPTQ